MWKHILKWFVDKAWPTIIQFLRKYEREIMSYVFQWVESIFSKKKESTNEEFRGDKAREAEAQAKVAKNEEDRIRYEAEAKAFREALSILEKQYQKFQSDLEEIKQKVEKEVSNNTNKLRAEDLFNTGKNGKITIKQEEKYLSIDQSK